MDTNKICVNCLEHFEKVQSNSNEPSRYCSFECECEDRNEDVI